MLAVVAAVGVTALGIGALGAGRGGSGAATSAAAPSGVKLPPKRTADLAAAAKAAGCSLQNPPNEGAGHADKPFTAADYDTNPPTSGTHFPQWASDGVYAPGNAPQLGMLVHTLEHGRIDVQYKLGTPKQVEQQLEALVAEQDGGYHTLLFENPTRMRYQVAASAWTHLLGCPQMNDQVFDAIRAFRDKYVDQGPETVP